MAMSNKQILQIKMFGVPILVIVHDEHFSLVSIVNLANLSFIIACETKRKYIALSIILFILDQ